MSKSGKSRVGPLSDAALDVLDQIGTEGKYGYVFINPDTEKPYTHIRHTWIRIRERAGMPWLRLHDLRHSFAVGTLLRWYRTGVDPGAGLLKLATFMGHVDARSTAVYLTITAALFQEANRRFEAFARPILVEGLSR